MSNKVYDVLKWVVMIVLPAVLTFFGVLGATLDWSFTDTVITIGTAFITMLGTILGISNINYNSKNK